MAFINSNFVFIPSSETQRTANNSIYSLCNVTAVCASQQHSGAEHKCNYTWGKMQQGLNGFVQHQALSGEYIIQLEFSRRNCAGVDVNIQLGI